MGSIRRGSRIRHSHQCPLVQSMILPLPLCLHLHRYKPQHHHTGVFFFCFFFLFFCFFFVVLLVFFFSLSPQTCQYTRLNLLSCFSVLSPPLLSLILHLRVSQLLHFWLPFPPTSFSTNITLSILEMRWCFTFTCIADLSGVIIQ